MSQIYDLSIEKGSAFDFIIDASGITSANLANYTSRLIVKKRDDASTNIIAKTGVRTDSSLAYNLNPSDTSIVKRNYVYYIDIDSSADNFTLIKGRFDII